MWAGFIQFRKCRQVYPISVDLSKNLQGWHDCKKSIRVSILSCEIDLQAASLAFLFLIAACMRKDTASCIHLTCSSCLIKVPPLNTPPHLLLEHPNFLSRRIVISTRTDGHTSSLQIIMRLLIRLERFEKIFTEECLVFYSHHWL